MITEPASTSNEYVVRDTLICLHRSGRHRHTSCGSDSQTSNRCMLISFRMEGIGLRIDGRHDKR
jgi:hypothetical protein